MIKASKWIWLIGAVAVLCWGKSSIAGVSFDWAFVDSPGNPPDRSTGFGSVDEVFRLSKHEVTNEQYTEFLNNVAAADPNGLFNPKMEIVRAGEDGAFSYATREGFDLHPVVQVSFFDAMRFTNWLHNGQPTGEQSAQTTEAGAYLLSQGQEASRDPNARYFIPTENEWFKAAYYDPAAQTYRFYPTGSNQVPIGQGSLNGSRSVNMMMDFDGTGLEATIEVGTYLQAQSNYGTFDQAGNVWEWNETVINVRSRGTLGGGFYDIPQDSIKDLRNWQLPRLEAEDFGFRVASVPEPASAQLFLTATVTVLACLRRRRR